LKAERAMRLEERFGSEKIIKAERARRTEGEKKLQYFQRLPFEVTFIFPCFQNFIKESQVTN
jgi:hypothetical protein